jgi:hypothetical protein
MGSTDIRKLDPHKQVEVWFGKVPSDTSTREKRENEYRCHDELP